MRRKRGNEKKNICLELQRGQDILYKNRRNIVRKRKFIRGECKPEQQQKR